MTKSGTSGDYFAKIIYFLYVCISITENFLFMTYNDYELAFSVARLTKYKAACNGDNFRALTLYRHNIKLCQKFYGVLNVFEIILRNAIDRHYRMHFNDNDWISSQLKDGGMLANYPRKAEIQKTILALVRQGKYTHDRLVSSVTFGFWTYLFTKIPFRIGGQSLLQIFPNKTVGLGQKAIYKELIQIKDFRNKIAHHEAICFNAVGQKSMVSAQTHYAMILKYVDFLGYSKDHIFFGMDVIPETTMTKIQNL